MKQFLKNLKKRQDVLLLIFLFASAVVWRSWYSLEHFSFQQDLARDILLTENWKDSGKILIGYGPKASVGDFYLPPLYYQMYVVLAYIFPFAPFAMVWLTIFVEAATPVFLFLLFKKIFTKNMAIILAVSYIFFVLPMVYASSAWNPNMIPLCAIASLYSYVRYLENKKGWLIIPAVLCVTFAIHLHFQAALLLPFSIGMFCFTFFKDKKNVKYWFYAVLLSLVTLAGYFWTELQNNFSNTQHIVNYFTHDHTMMYERVSKPAFILNFLPNFIERLMTGNVRYYSFISMGRVLFFLGMAAMCGVAWKERKKQPIHVVLFLYFVSLFVMLRVYKGDKLDYYMSPLFILPSFLFGYLVKLHKLFWILLVVTIFYIVQFYLLIPKFDQYKDINASAQILTELIPDKHSRFYFYSSEDINTFAYGIRQFTDIEVNQHDTDIVEICALTSHCYFEGKAECKYSREYTNMALLKIDAGYSHESSKYTDQFQIIKGKLENTLPPKIPFYHENHTVGSDKLLPELYQ